jgi:hypothetical protein
VTRDWKSRIRFGHPCWRGYRRLLDTLPGSEFPHTGHLDALLPKRAVSGSGARIRFVPASRLAGVSYEQHIYETGEVSTRAANWHDLFNALVWCRLPRLKSAMNTLHYRHLDDGPEGGRGSVRDALTLLDESGVIVMGTNSAVLGGLKARDWNSAFVAHRDAWRDEVRVLVCGHAILEKFLQPYKSITAHALYLHVGQLPGTQELDSQLAGALLEDHVLHSTSGLSPLPLTGIPGWWPEGPQDTDFYADRSVFRPAHARA